MAAERVWRYRNVEIEEGLKPASKHFQYFFLVKKGGKKKCNFCIWIDDENLPHFAPTNDFEAIAYSLREEWKKWVEEKIDQGDFRSLVLKLEKKGSRVINLSEMEEKMKAQ